MFIISETGKRIQLIKSENRKSEEEKNDIK